MSVFKHATVVKALATGKRLVGHFSHSAVVTQALIEHQSRMGIERPLKLVKDIQTRWNSGSVRITCPPLYSHL